MGVGFRLDAPFAALICLASIFLSLLTTIWRFFNQHFKLMHVALLKLLAADYWPITEASVGFRLDASFAALICLASIFLSLPTTIWRFFNPYFRLMHVALLKLRTADFWPTLEAGVRFRLDASFAASICFAGTTLSAATIYALPLPVVTWSPLSPCLQLLHAATPMLLISVSPAMIIFGVCLWQDTPTMDRKWFAVTIDALFQLMMTWRLISYNHKLIHAALSKLLGALPLGNNPWAVITIAALKQKAARSFADASTHGKSTGPLYYLRHLRSCAVSNQSQCSSPNQMGRCNTVITQALDKGAERIPAALRTGPFPALGPPRLPPVRNSKAYFTSRQGVTEASAAARTPASEASATHVIPKRTVASG